MRRAEWTPSSMQERSLGPQSQSSFTDAATPAVAPATDEGFRCRQLIAISGWGLSRPFNFQF